MSKTVSFAFYTLSAYEKRQIGKPINLQEENVADDLNRILSSFSTYDSSYSGKDTSNSANDNSKLMFLEQDTYTYSSDRIEGRLRAGEGGLASDIVDGYTGKLKAERLPKDVEVIPFYFDINIPERGTIIIALQRFGVYAMASGFRKKILHDLNLLHPEWTFKIMPIFVGDLYLDKYISDGKIKKIEVLKSEIPRDRGTKVKKIKQTSKITLTPERGGSFGDIKDLFPNSDSRDDLKRSEIIKRIHTMYELDVGEDCEIKVKIELGKNIRTVEVGNLDRFATFFDISDDVLRDDDGHPVLTSISDISNRVINEDIRSIITK